MSEQDADFKAIVDAAFKTMQKVATSSGTTSYEVHRSTTGEITVQRNDVTSTYPSTEYERQKNAA